MDWNNPDEVREYNRQYRERNRERLDAKRQGWYAANRDSVLAYHKQYRLDNPDKVREGDRRKAERVRRDDPEFWARFYQTHKERMKQRGREYFAKNHDALCAASSAYYYANRSNIREGRREYYQRTKVSSRAIRQASVRNYRARQRQAGGTHTEADVQRIWKRQGCKCAVLDCAYPIADAGCHKYHVDHVKAIANGGSNGPDNLQILCGPHNVQKAARDEYEWAQETAGLLFV